MSDHKQPPPTTPGRPKETGSRQQRHRRESSHPHDTGERKSSDRPTSSVPVKPPGAK
jgi:hypothetical protein